MQANKDTPEVRAEGVRSGTAIVAGASAAAIALVNPIAGIAAAGLAPFLVDRINGLQASRAAIALEKLESNPKLLDDSLFEGSNAETRVDLISEYISAAIGTSSNAKIDLLLRILDDGLHSEQQFEILFAKRIIRTLSRIDELEIEFVGALLKSREGEPSSVDMLTAETRIKDSNVVRSTAAILESEGLIVRSDADAERYSISDYGSSIFSYVRLSQDR